MSDNKNPAPYSCAASGCLHDILATRLAVAEAERDAAVGRVALEMAARDMLRAEGERRAMAAIVADLRARFDPASWDSDSPILDIADRYERGDHLKGTSNE